MTYDPQGQYPPPNQDPNAGGYPTSGGAYPTSGGAYPASGGPYPPQSGQPYQQGGYQASSYDPYQQQPGYQQPGYPPQPGYAPQAGQPAVDPATGQPLSDKTKLAAGLFSLLLGSFGVGRFYLGYTGLGVAQIFAVWCTAGLGAIWPLIEGIMILANNSIPDAQGRKLRDN